MIEILTESFCERCGTRYTFESVAPRQRRLAGIRVLGRGLKNFVMSDNTSLDEAMAAARSDSEREATAQQLDAFHRTFNFCMSCRQYTCGNCWNAVDGRCLSCSPLAIEAAAEAGAGATLEAPDTARLLRIVAPPAEGSEPAGEIESVEGVERPAIDAEENAIRVDVAAATTGPGVLDLEPGENVDDAIAAYEASVAKVAATGAGIDIVEQPTWPTGPVEPEAEAEPEAQPEAETVPESEALTGAARAAAPAIGRAPEPEVGAGPPAPAAPEAPVEPPPEAPHWPTGPRWPTGLPASPPAAPAGDPLAAIMARQATEAMWAASSRDVIGPPLVAQAAPTAGVQSCVSCGISLSANARFCRRCGTSQVG